MVELFTNPDTWWALLQICIINVVLSGDNAVVIALACRSLPPKQARMAFIVGAVGIIVLMTGLTAAASYLLDIPYVAFIGSLLLIWIAIKLLVPEDEDDDLEGGSHFWEAVKIIIIADIVMSLDNVLGMAAVAKGHTWMLFIGNGEILGGMEIFGSALSVESELGLGKAGRCEEFGVHLQWSGLLANGASLGGMERFGSALVVESELGLGQIWAV